MTIATLTRRPVLEFNGAVEPFGRLELVVHRGELVLALCPDLSEMARVWRLALGMDLIGAGEVRVMEFMQPVLQTQVDWHFPHMKDNSSGIDIRCQIYCCLGATNGLHALAHVQRTQGKPIYIGPLG